MKYLAQILVLLGALALTASGSAPEFDDPVVAAEKANEQVRDPHAAMIAAFGQGTLENGEFMWKDGTTELDRLVIDLTEQLMFAYDDDELVGVSTVSTGRRGHETRPGNFSILAKHRYYYSKKYDNAPMPYMQQITSYGVAFHAGAMPGYPASHGCVRLPTQFAAKLFATTRIGTPVLITP